MKKTRGVLWGIAIIALGVFWALKEANIITDSIFFDGWWSIFIIVPSIIGLITDKNKTGSLICLTIGVVLLVSCYYDIWQYKAFFIPIFIVFIGASIIYNSIIGKKKNNTEFNTTVVDSNAPTVNPVQNASNQEYYASFSGENYVFDKGFAGGKFDASFGAIKIDIRNSDIVDGCVINTNATFGGIEILVPQNVRVIAKSNNFFGGTSDKSNKALPADAKTVYVNATNKFGGTDIK